MAGSGSATPDTMTASDESLDGRVALVTGAGSGIGRATALELSGRGAHVVILDINRDSANETARLIGTSSSMIVADCADLAVMRAGVAKIIAELGRLDILVNNAAQGGGPKFADVTEDAFDRLFAVNVRGVFFTTQAVVPAMKAKGWGRIINVASLIGARGTDGNPHYAGAKAALFGFTRSWAVELAPYGITVNTVVPALTVTPMAATAMSEADFAAKAKSIPMGRMGESHDHAALIGFLCSPAAAYLTGQAISPNGAEYVGAL